MRTNENSVMMDTGRSSRMSANQRIKTDTGDVSAITVGIEKGKGQSMAQTVVMKRESSRSKLHEKDTLMQLASKSKDNAKHMKALEKIIKSNSAYV